MAVQKILVVEDEPLIAMMIEDFLDMLGKSHAGTADNVSEALAMVDAGGIDAAILDLNLRGGETSWPVAERLAQAGVPFIFASGGLGESVDPPFNDRPVLPKPFTIDAVAKALDGLG
ncbi:MAG: transcriptional regulator [Proteobacteria bacterium SG_bin6]|nr:MAG: transcriptional regulator [Proteobacteria bacterium SG_bin6]